MCFSGEMSLAFAAAGAGTSLLLWARKRPAWASGLLLYFALMETLQYLQYMFMEEACPHPQGHAPSGPVQALMLASYLHICAQPFMLNWFSFSLQQSLTPDRTHFGEVRRAVLWLSAAAGALLLLKGLPAYGVPEQALPFPLRVCTAGSEFLCDHGAQGYGCGASGRLHVAWKMRLLETGYYIPGMSLHFFMFFLPTLVLCGWPLKAMFSVLLVTGPLMVDRLYTGDMANYLLEGPAVWCFFSVAQVLVALVWELCIAPARSPQPGQEAAKKQH